MIELYTRAWFEKMHEVRDAMTLEHPEDYKAIVREVVKILPVDERLDQPDPNRIHQIDDGDYQGTLVFVIGATGYQPDAYWYVKVGYGSCSGCDTLEGIRGYSSQTPDEKEVGEYMQLALHVLQGIRKMGD